MTKNELLKELDELIDINGRLYSFYLEWMPYLSGNIRCNDHGDYDRLLHDIDVMEESENYIEGLLPFETLVVYFNNLCVVYKPNPLYDIKEDPSCMSHVSFGVPYVGTKGEWLYLNGTPEVEYVKNNNSQGE